jgi:thioester reductase-like protein
MGYARSKWVAEHVVAAAARVAQVPARVVRVGQVCGDTEAGVWNAAEAVPMTVRAAWTIGALPVADDDDEEVHWLPVDVAARALADVALADERGFHVLHVVNEAGMCWNRQFLPRLRKLGLEFEALPQREWVRMLEASDQDGDANPPVKLLDFFRSKYASSPPPQGGAAPIFDTTLARTWAPGLRGGVEISEEMVGRFLRYWTEEAWVKKRQDSGAN